MPSYPADLRRSDSVTVVIPTFQRSDALQDAVRSVASQTLPNTRIHLIVVDNNPTPQERDLVRELSSEFANGIVYLHEPVAGLSNARNAAMTMVETRYLAFLDDDMIASPVWLEALIGTSRRLGAGIVFGPNHARLPDPGDMRADYMRAFFSRRLDLPGEAFVEATHGAGGSLLDLSLCYLPSPAFDPKLNQRGGEDDILFDTLTRTGTLSAWSPEAVCEEVVPKERARLSYIVARSFGYGQGPVRISASRGVKGWPGILYYMMAGSAQLALYTPLFAWNRLQNHPSSLHYASRWTQALGKIFWGERFSRNLYGRRVAGNKTRTESAPSEDDSAERLTA
ncbi:MAG: glycosyltransferase family 2 protein [Litorimonas sp.]